MTPQSVEEFRPLDFRSRMPALDGVRALAIVMVFLDHFGISSHGGKVIQVFNQVFGELWIGVDLFFVLSGFLITGILYDTRNDSQYFKRFFARRTVRIFPLYYGVFAVIGLLTIFLRYQWRLPHISFLVYLGNYFTISDPGVGLFVSSAYPDWTIRVSHFWSLCVEEQFYLIWPLIVRFVKDRRTLIRLAGGVGLLALLGRVLMFSFLEHRIAANWVFQALPFRADALLIGAILALLLRGPRADFYQRGCRWLFFISFFVGLSIFLVPHTWPGIWIYTIGLTFTASTAAGLIGVTTRAGSLAFRIFRLKPLLLLGKYSYGFYVYHLLFAKAWLSLFNRWMDRFPKAIKASVTLPIVFLVIFAVSKLSYDLFESKFLRLKRRFEYDIERETHKHAFR